MASSTGAVRAGPGLCSSVLLLLLLADISGPVSAVSEPGKWILNVESETLKTQKYFYFAKTLFNGSYIHLRLNTCNSSSPVHLNISWYLRNSHCRDEVFKMNPQDRVNYFMSAKVKPGGGSGYYVFHQYTDIPCQPNSGPHTFGLETMDVKTRLTELQPSTEQTSGRRKRDVEPPKPKPVASEKGSAAGEPGKAAVPPKEVTSILPLDAVAQSWEDGSYMFILSIEAKDNSPDRANQLPTWNLQLSISMKGPHDYISASEWPLMVFYMVMCIVYVLLALLWLVLSACYWRDLLRIQFWIGGVIFLGMLEKAVYYAEYQSIRYDGLPVYGAVVFAEVLSAVKRTLARVLVIIASLGYGIVKPRLGALLHRVVGVGLLYLMFCIIEGILRVTSELGNNNNSKILCEIVLAFTDACIVWWISFCVYTLINTFTHAHTNKPLPEPKRLTHLRCKHTNGPVSVYLIFSVHTAGSCRTISV